VAQGSITANEEAEYYFYSMKILNFIRAALFIVSAGLQINDPDPLLWIGLYLAVGLICLLAAFGKYNRWVILAVMAVCVYELSTLYPDFRQWLGEGMPSITESMKATSPHVELIREFRGVALCFAALIFQYFRARLIALRSSAGSVS
jgi:hypothetical protein